MTSPSGPTKNFAKFHLMSAPSGKGSDFSALRCAQTGCVFGPLTSHFSKSGKVAPYLPRANSRISEAEPGSWPPNWLQGKARTQKPRDSRRDCSSCS